MEEVTYNTVTMLYLGWEGGKTANTLLCKGCINDAITVRQPYASLLVNGEKAFEYRSRKLPESLRDKIIFIHAGKQSKREKVNITDELYDKALEQAKAEKLFGCIIGCVVFGKPEKLVTGYAWPVKISYKLFEPIRNVNGRLGIWKFKVR